MDVCNLLDTPTGTKLAVPKPCTTHECSETKIPTDDDKNTIKPVESVIPKRKKARPKAPALHSGLVGRVMRTSLFSNAGKPSPSRYDPLEADYQSKDIVGKFYNWYNNAKATKS